MSSRELPSTTIAQAHPPQLKSLIKRAYRLRRPIYVWGGPGTGKSTITRQAAMELAQELGLEFSDHPRDFQGSQGKFVLIDLRLSLLDPSDLRGLPKIEFDSTRWIPPSFLPRQAQGMIFMDELNLAAPTIQAAAYQLILDRRLGEYLLPEGWSIVAAGNKVTEGALFELPPALANRFIHVELVNNVKHWSDWAIAHGIHPTIIGFLNFRPELLYKFSPGTDEKAFPTPRSWQFLSELLKDSSSDELSFELIASSAVGMGAAREFCSFLELVKEIRDPDAYLEDPELSLPNEISKLYALISAIAGRVRSDPNQHKVDAACRLAERLCQEGKPEIGLLLIRLLGRDLMGLLVRSKQWSKLRIRWKDYL